MSTVREFMSRVAAVFGRRRSDAELSDEIRTHLDSLLDEHIRRGLSPIEARAAARRDFGGVDQIKEQYRDQRGWSVLDAIREDLRFAFRTCVKNRGFAAVAILTLAIGIGANTAVFTLIDSLLLRWLPVTEPQQLVQIKIVRHERMMKQLLRLVVFDRGTSNGWTGRR